MGRARGVPQSRTTDPTSVRISRRSASSWLREERREEVFVDPGFDATQLPVPLGRDGNPTASAADHDRAEPEQLADATEPEGLERGS